MKSLKISLFVVFAISAILVYKTEDFLNYLTTPQRADVLETWWGKADQKNEDRNIYPFKINVSQDLLDDLRYRLEHTRPFTKPLLDNQLYGFNGNLAEEILQYWKTKYDWRKSEKFLNKLPQFTTSIQGLKIHFLHVKPQNISKSTKILPLLLAHGWPGSVREFYKIIPMLTTQHEDYDFVFEVIAPHLPGFVFSEATTKPGLGPLETALIFKNLMNRLGFDRFYVQGGDLGSVVLQAMSVHFPESVLGFHSNMCGGMTAYSMVKLFLASFYPKWIANEFQRNLILPLTKFVPFLLSESGYLHIQASKPDTLGVAIDDSPMGLAVYILEKFSTGGSFDHRFQADGGLKKKFTYDELLDNVMLYWVNKCATTSFRFYSEFVNFKEFFTSISIPVTVPTICARFKYDIVGPDIVIRDVYQNMVQLKDYDGGHFAALELPQVLSEDIFEGIAKIEALNGTK